MSPSKQDTQAQQSVTERAQDPREREIQRQFLDEAQAYLTTLEGAVLGLAGSRVDLQKVNEAMRASHSIKGGAAMMGYQTLSEFAHRLEDSFKVLKTKRQSLAVSTDLENQLLTGVDCLQRVIQVSRQEQEIDSQWLEQVAHPLFDQLRLELGDPEEENAASVLGGDDGGQELLSIIFSSEVEAVLQQLEGLLQNPVDADLRGELMTLAGELGGLGEMLQLPAFTNLCESVLETLDQAQEEAKVIAQAALSAWRRAQALVLTQQLDLIPTHLDTVGSNEVSSHEVRSTTAASNPPSVSSAPTPEHSSPNVVETWGDESTMSPEVAAAIAEFEAAAEAATQAAALEVREIDAATLEVTEASSRESFTANALTAEAAQTKAKLAEATASIPPGALEIQDVSSSDIWNEPASPQIEGAEDEDRTVRVSLKRVEQLNDLFGELTIERNALALYCDRLRSLTQLLKQRVKTLDQTNRELRTSYDELASGGRERLLSRTHDFNQRRRYSSNGHSSNGHSSNSYSSGSSVVSINRASQGSGRAGFDRLEMDQYNNLSLQSQSVIENIVQIQEVTTDIDLSLEESDQTLRNLNKTTKHLRNQLTHLRMRPLSDVLDRFPRALRDLGREHGKRVKLKLEGSDTLVDRNVLEALQEPLMHLLRNAFDHGLESPEERAAQGKSSEGVVTIRAFQRSNRTIVEFQDDGRGIDLDKVRAKAEALGLDRELLTQASQQELLSLIFEPGFSTSSKVTSLSGRGVGMDVVRDRLKPVRGEIAVDTQPGQGTTFILSVPFSLAVLRVLVVESQGMLVAVPADSVTEVALVDQIPSGQAQAERFDWNGELVQRLHLGSSFEFNCPRPPYSLEANPKIDSPAILLVKQGEQLIGLEIERSWGEQEVAVRQVEGLIGMPSGFSNCTIMGDGRVIPLVNVTQLSSSLTGTAQPSILQNQGQTDALPHASSKTKLAPESGFFGAEILPFAAATKPAVLVVDDSINVRRFLALTLEKAGYRVEQAKDGQQALELLAGDVSVQAIICDIEMPRLDGYGVLAKVKADPAIAHLPIAMLTSRSGEKHRKLAMDLGASAYFSKPYNEQELLTQLEAMMIAA